MKKFAIYIFILTSINVLSQNNGLNINSRWFCSSGEWSGPCVQHDEFNNYFTGDTLINGNQYFKLYQTSHTYQTFKYPNIPCPSNDQYFSFNTAFLVRYHQKKLLIWSSSANKDTVFLDYNLNVGDTIQNVGYTDYTTNFDPLIVTSIDSVLINSSYLKRYNYISNENGINNTRYIIEKIGSYHGFINLYTSNFENSNRLHCYGENFLTLYSEPSSTLNCDLTVGVKNDAKKETKATIFPNPTSQYVQIDLNGSDRTIKRISVQNYLGEIVLENILPIKESTYDLSSLKKGIYLIEIKTEMGTFVNKIIKE